MNQDDQHLHVPTEQEDWAESHYTHAVDPDTGVTAQVRLGYLPNQGEADVFAWFTGDEHFYGVHDKAVPLENVHGTTARSDEWAVSLIPAAAPNEWTVSFDGKTTKVPLDAPGDILRRKGDVALVECEFTITPKHDPYYYSEAESWPERPGNRYEVAVNVDGTATLAGEKTAFGGYGEKDHSWGPRDWFEVEMFWMAGGFEDGTAFNLLAAPAEAAPGDRIANGFWFDGERRWPLAEGTLSANPPVVDRGESVQALATSWARNGDAPEFSVDVQWADGSNAFDIEPTVTTSSAWTDEERGRRALMIKAPSELERTDGTGGGGVIDLVAQTEP